MFGTENVNPRPTSVTVIAWILIVGGGIDLIVRVLTIGNPVIQNLASKSALSRPFLFGMVFLGLLVTIFSGVFILRGKAWARNLYVGWCVAQTMVGLINAPITTAMLPRLLLAFLPAILVFGLIVYCLYGPKAARYFQLAAVREDGETPVIET